MPHGRILWSPTEKPEVEAPIGVEKVKRAPVRRSESAGPPGDWAMRSKELRAARMAEQKEWRERLEKPNDGKPIVPNGNSNLA